MTSPNQSDSAAPSALELAHPQFRFPVRVSQPAEPAPLATPNARSSQYPEGPEATAPRTIFHGPHSTNSAPLRGPHHVERYVGWSMQEVSWVNSLELEPDPQDVAPTNERSLRTESALPSTPLAEPVQRVSAADPVSPGERPSSMGALPVDLNPSPAASPIPATHWSINSRAQVTGFAIQRTKVAQPQTIVSGAGLAAGHRRWAARNHSAELQARSVGLELSSSAALPNEPGWASSEARAAESPATRNAGLLSGGLPLVVHPDFRWSPVVERLAAGGDFAEQLLAVAEQLLHEGQGRLLFASTQRQQGATTLAAATARMLIDRGRRVLMVDADLGQAGWTSSLELRTAGSWVQQVEAFEPLQAAMAISRQTSCAFVGLHPVLGRRELPPFLLDYLGQLLVPFKEQFDATIIDVGPISQLLEELSQPARLGTAVMVVQQGGADAAIDLRRNKTTLNAFGISRLAIARNFAA